MLREAYVRFQVVNYYTLSSPLRSKKAGGLIPPPTNASFKNMLRNASEQKYPPSQKDVFFKGD